MTQTIEDLEITFLKLEQLAVPDDRSTQPRAILDQTTVNDYLDAYLRGDYFPPLKTIYDGENYWLYDGFHRREAALILLGQGQFANADQQMRIDFIRSMGLSCEVKSGSLLDAQWEALSQNMTHGLRRSRSDYPRLVELAVAHPYAQGKSYRELAQQVRIDPKTFKTHWIDLADRGQVAPPAQTIEVTRGDQTYEMERIAPIVQDEESDFLHGSDANREENLEGEAIASEPTPSLPLAPLSIEDNASPSRKLSNEKYTPRAWRDFAEKVFGRAIELDPASCELANQVIGAERIYTLEDNAMQQDWTCKTLWLNPPYSMPEVQQFSVKLLEELPNIEQAIVLVNACTETKWFQDLAMQADRILFPNYRINFWGPEDNPDDIKGANEYRQALFYFCEEYEMTIRFDELAKELGLVVIPLNSEDL